MDEWLERLAVNAKVATVLGSIRQSRIGGAADEAVLNNVHKKYCNNEDMVIPTFCSYEFQQCCYITEDSEKKTSQNGF
jgi:hypothetical protein